MFPGEPANSLGELSRKIALQACGFEAIGGTDHFRGYEDPDQGALGVDHVHGGQISQAGKNTRPVRGAVMRGEAPYYVGGARDGQDARPTAQIARRAYCEARASAAVPCRGRSAVLRPWAAVRVSRTKAMWAVSSMISARYWAAIRVFPTPMVP